MLRIDRPTVCSVPDPVSGLFLTLNRPVMAFLADAFEIVEIEEHIPIAAMWFHVVYDDRHDQLSALVAAFT